MRHETEDGRPRAADGPALVFVYNAASGLFNAVADAAHKLLSPDTYGCNLCALTHTTFGMRGEWKQFLNGLGRPVEFLHADELGNQYGARGVALPAVFERRGGRLELLIDADRINGCRTTDELKQLILKTLPNA